MKIENVFDIVQKLHKLLQHHHTKEYWSLCWLGLKYCTYILPRSDEYNTMIKYNRSMVKREKELTGQNSMQLEQAVTEN